MRALASLLLLGLTAGVAAGAAAGAQPPGRAAEGLSERAAPRPGLERLARTIERSLQLDDAQAAQLRAVSSRYAPRRQALAAREREARRTLRHELGRGDAAEQGRVRAALDDLLALQRQRLELVGAEQQELSRFLTPVQRARFLALQERALRAAQRARMQRDTGEFRGGRGYRGRRSPG